MTDLAADDTVDLETGWRKWMVVIILMCGGVLTTLSFTAIIPALPHIASDFQNQGGTLSAQMVMTIVAIGMMVGGPVAGWLGERLGLRPALFIFLTAYSLFGVSGIVIDQLWLLLLARLALGFCAVGVDASMVALLSAYFSGDARARFLGVRQGIGSTGTLTSVLLAGWMAEHWGWRSNFGLYGVGFVVLALAAFALRAPAKKRATVKATEPFPVLEFWPLLVGTTLITVCHAMPSVQLPFLLRQDGMTSAIDISHIVALSSVAGILGSFAFGWVRPRLMHWTLVMAMTVMGFGYIGVGAVHDLSLMPIAVLVAGFGGGFQFPFFAVLILDQVSAAVRPRAFGFFMSAVFVGEFLNPLVMTPTRSLLGIHATFIALGACMLAASVAMGATLNFRKRRQLSVSL